MKKEEKLNRLFGEIDDDLVADATAKPIPLKVWLPRITAAVAAVALTVGLAVAQPWASEKPPISNGSAITTITTTPQDNGGADRNDSMQEVEPGAPIASAPDNVAPPRPTAGTPTTAAEWTPDIWYEQPWEEKPMWRRYPDFERFEIGTYIVNETATVTADKLGDYLGEVNLHGYDNATQTGHDEIGKIYRIEGIFDGAAVALQYPEENEYFVAVGSKYFPDTLGDLIDDLSLREHLQVGTVYYSYRDENGNIHDIYYDGLTAEKVFELLLSDTSLPNVADQPIEWEHKLAIRIDMPLLGYHNISITLSKDGYMRIHLLYAEKIFHIGTDKVNALLTYAEENCRVSHDQQIALPDDTNAVSGTTMTSAAQKPRN